MEFNFRSLIFKEIEGSVWSSSYSRWQSNILRASTPCAPAAGLKKEGELANTSLEFEFHLQIPCGSRSTEVSDFRQSARSGNERECNKHWKTSAKGNDVISNVISANQHFASKKFDADIQIPQTQLQALLPFLAPPPERPGELTRRHTKQGHFKIKRGNSTARTVRILVDTRVCVCWTV